jgi:asparaginyl-tRNA synthetase
MQRCWYARHLRSDSNIPFFKRLTNGASVRLTGVLTPSPGPGQESELLAEAVEVLGPCDPEVHQTLTLVF